jgi:hypothetical protein
MKKPSCPSWCVVSLLIVVLLLPTCTFAVNLGACEDLAVMAETAITFAANTIVNGGNVGIGSGNLAAIIGTFTGAGSVKQPSTVGQCSLDERQAYNAATAPAPGSIVITAAMGGKTFSPGTYHAATLSTAAADVVTLNGGPSDIFIFQTDSTLDFGASTKFQLTGGVCPGNIFWAPASAATIGANSTFYGTILSGSAITLGKGVIVNGRLFAQSAIVIGDESTVDAGSSSVCGNNTTTTPAPGTTTPAPAVSTLGPSTVSPSPQQAQPNLTVTPSSKKPTSSPSPAPPTSTNPTPAPTNSDSALAPPSLSPAAPALPSQMPHPNPTSKPGGTTGIPTLSQVTPLPTPVGTTTSSPPPTIMITLLPSLRPTILPSLRPTILPSLRPTILPSLRPSRSPSQNPTSSLTPSVYPSGRIPSASPSHDSSCEDLSGIDIFFGDTIGFKNCNWLSGRKADMATFCVPTHR